MVPKIAFLFLAINSINHENVWVKFFKGHEAQYSLYVHPKKEFGPASFFAKAIIPQREETTWANVLKAQLALLKEALKDPANTKFIFCSDSTIPIMYFDGVYKRFLAHPHSEIFYEKNSDTVSSWRYFGDQITNVYKNMGWIVLNRKHAQLMVDDKTMSAIFMQYPIDCEHYPSTFLAHNNLLGEVVNQYPVFEFWTDHNSPHPHLFEDLKTDPYRERLLTAIKSKKFAFARKFAPTCNLDLFHKYLPQLY